MKSVLKIILVLVGLFSILLVAFATVLFFNPTMLIKPKYIDYALKKTSILNSWSWSRAEITHKWIRWNQREFTGNFKNLCLDYDKSNININSCMEEVSWNLELKWKYKLGFSYFIKRPLIIDSKKTKISLKNTLGEKKESAGTDYLFYWNILFNSTPDLDFNFRSIDLLKDGKLTPFNLRLIKSRGILSVKALNYELTGTAKKITILAQKKFLLPYDLKTKKPLYINELKLLAEIKESKITINIKSKIDTAELNIQSEISREQLKQPENWLENLLLQTNAHLEISKVSKTIKKVVRPPFNILPAPFNVMEGSLKINLTTQKLQTEKNSMLIKITTSLDMAGASQFILMDLSTEFPFKLNDRSIGAITIGIDLKKVSIRLPKLSKSGLPPQLSPDSRFKGVKNVAENVSAPPHTKKKSKRKIEYKLNLEALGDRALQLKTNLLDEILKLNFKLEIEDKTIQDGHIVIHPLRTTIFKRPIYITSLRINFDAPLEPKIISIVEFNLPEYLITLKLEGPLSKPRHSFSSNPPLPQDDIIAVLLFGKPLSALGPDDKTTTKNANQIISQGILSLAVLYYLAGSPVESIGYDPDSKVVSAQFGLGTKSSLYVTNKSSESGLNSYGIRHSLGKGWYIDSSVQKKTDTIKSNGSDYGVLLERIISY